MTTVTRTPITHTTTRRGTVNILVWCSKCSHRLEQVGRATHQCLPRSRDLTVDELVFGLPCACAGRP
jgi:hypothetical protein